VAFLQLNAIDISLSMTFTKYVIVVFITTHRDVHVPKVSSPMYHHAWRYGVRSVGVLTFFEKRKTPQKTSKP